MDSPSVSPRKHSEGSLSGTLRKLQGFLNKISPNNTEANISAICSMNLFEFATTQEEKVFVSRETMDKIFKAVFDVDNSVKNESGKKLLDSYAGLISRLVNDSSGNRGFMLRACLEKFVSTFNEAVKVIEDDPDAFGVVETFKVSNSIDVLYRLCENGQVPLLFTVKMMEKFYGESSEHQKILLIFYGCFYEALKKNDYFAEHLQAPYDRFVREMASGQITHDKDGSELEFPGFVNGKNKFAAINLLEKFN